MLFQNVDFHVDVKEIVFIVGPSGAGKSLLLRALACLDEQARTGWSFKILFIVRWACWPRAPGRLHVASPPPRGALPQAGSLFLEGKTPLELGVPAWRARVCYISQGRWAFPGSPRATFGSIKAYASQRSRSHGDLEASALALGLEPALLDQTWASLSGGQAQRGQLAIGVALRPDVLLLDEPTSALDAESVRLAEAHLKGCGSAVVWVTHDPGQPARVGGRVVQFPPPSAAAAV